MVRAQPISYLKNSWKKPKIVEGKDWKIEPPKKKASKLWSLCLVRKNEGKSKKG
jgi:hypothetical protein